MWWNRRWCKRSIKKANIKLYGGVYGNADSIVNDFINGKLKYNENVQCSHHESYHNSCGEHKCNENKNGCHGNKIGG